MKVSVFIAVSSVVLFCTLEKVSAHGGGDGLFVYRDQFSGTHSIGLNDLFGGQSTYGANYEYNPWNNIFNSNGWNYGKKK